MSHSISISTGWCWVQHSLAAQSCVFQGVAKAFWMGQVITKSDSLGRQRIFSALSLQSLQTSHNDNRRWLCNGIVGVGVAFLPLIRTLEVKDKLERGHCTDLPFWRSWEHYGEGGKGGFFLFTL